MTLPTRSFATIALPSLTEVEAGDLNPQHKDTANSLPPSLSHEGRMGVGYTFTTDSHTHSWGGGGYFMSSDLASILSSAITVTRGVIKGKIGKDIVTGTVAFKIERSAYFLSADMGSTSDLTQMWVRLWWLGVYGSSWGWSTSYSISIMCQTRASGIGFGTPRMTTPSTLVNYVEFLCFGLRWCPWRIVQGWSWSIFVTFSNSACAPMILN